MRIRRSPVWMLTAALCLSIVPGSLVASGCADEPLLEPDAPGDDLGAQAEALGGAARFCDGVVTLEHLVAVGDGVRLRVVEKFSGRTVVARPRRAILMLTATLVTTAQYDTAVPGDESFDAMARLAQAGFDVFSVDYEGYGGSTRPADGRTVTAERSLEQMGVVVEWIRRHRRVPQVDLFGASLGSSLAMALGSEGGPVPTSHIGRIVLTSVVYREVTPLFQSVFFTPELRAFLENAPNGYVPTDPGAYGIILASADPAAAAWAASAFPGVYAVGPTLEGFELPVFDASAGRVPALQVWGDADLVTPRSDVDLFQAEWGGPVQLLELPGGGHAPTLEPVREAMWRGVLRFLGADPGAALPARRPQVRQGALERSGAHAPSGRSGAAQLARALADLGATHAFGLLGSAIAPVYDALHDVGLHVVHARHEAGAVFMAIEGHRATGRPAVVFTTTGPGLTNTLTGLAAAADEGARLVVVAAATERARLGRGAFQETGPEALALLDALPASPARRLGRYVDDAAALEEALDAVERGLRCPEGFVALLLVTPAAQQAAGPADRARPSLAPLPRELPDPALVDRAARRLAAAPFVVWAGRGALAAADGVRALVERTGARVMCTPRGKGVVDERHPAYLGVTGLGGHERVSRVLAAAPPAHVLVLGTRLGEMSSFFDAALAPTEAFVHVDLDERAFGAAYPAPRTLGIRADVGDFLRALMASLPGSLAPPGAPTGPSGAARAGVSSAPLAPLPEVPFGGGDALPSPADVFAAVQEVIIDGTDLPVMAEAGNAFAWAPHVLRLERPGRLLLSTRFGSMGHFATGVVGAALCSGRPAVAIVGDGALAMNDEISTAVEHGARAVWVVLNDARYGMVEHGMRAVGLRARGLGFPEIDFAAVAVARGAAGLRVRSVADLVPALRVALASPRPVVVDVRVDPAVPPPFGRRNDLLRRG